MVSKKKTKRSKEVSRMGFDFIKDGEIKDIWFYAALAILLLIGVIILG